MITKKITSIVFIIAIAAMFISSSAFIGPILAKNTTSNGKTTTSKATTSTGKSKTSTGKGNTATAQQNYTNFQKCLSTAAGTKGFATQLELKNCYNQVYHVLTSPGTSTATATSTAIGA